METSLKEKTAKGLFWGGFNSLFQQIIQTVFGIFMLRMLSPEEHGLVAMLGIFTLLATALQESGFSIALINKKEINKEEYSSVFWLNTGISLFLYLLLFFSAPLIAGFYDQPLLTDLSRFVFLSFVFNALGIVQNTVLTKQMEVKKMAVINLFSLLIACSTGLILTLLNFSYWAIAAQTVVLSFSKTLILWLMSDWRPSFLMKKEPLKEMFPFSVKILLSTLFSHLATEMYSLLLGKYYNEKQVGYYSQANKWYKIPLGVVLGISGSITLPLFAEVNDDPERQKLVFRKMLRFTSFITFPMILGFAFVANELTLVLITKKWIEFVPIIQLLCVTGIFSPFVVLYANLLTSKGRSGTVLILSVFNSILMISILLLTIRYGIIKMIFYNGFLNLFQLFLTLLATKKYIKINIGYFIKDVLPFLAITLFVFAIVYFTTSQITNLYVLLIAKIILSVAIFSLIMKFSRIVIFQECVDFVKKKIFNKK